MRQGKVIHTNIVIAGRLQLRQSQLEHGQFFTGSGNIVIGYAPLRFKALRQMGIGIQRNPIWPDGCYLRQSAREGIRALQW